MQIGPSLVSREQGCLRNPGQAWLSLFHHCALQIKQIPLLQFTQMQFYKSSKLVYHCNSQKLQKKRRAELDEKGFKCTNAPSFKQLAYGPKIVCQGPYQPLFPAGAGRCNTICFAKTSRISALSCCWFCLQGLITLGTVGAAKEQTT